MKQVNTELKEIIILSKKEYEEETPIKFLALLHREGYSVDHWNGLVYMTR